MILEIRLSNFFSIKDEIVLDLRAGNIKNQKAQDLLNNTIDFQDEKILKTIAIYGSNASGKSNILKSINFCIAMVLNSHTHNENDYFLFKPFKFQGYLTKPSSFFIRFVWKDIEYEYSYSLTQTEVITEELYFYPKGRKAKVFVRDERLSKDKSEIYSFSSLIKKPMDVALNTSKKSLFISRASQMDRDLPKEIFNFFNYSFNTRQIELNVNSVETYFKDYKRELLQALKIADSDIVDIKIKKETRIGKNVNANLTTNTVSMEDIPHELLNITTFHKSNPAIAFDFTSEESQGTQILFFNILIIIDAIKNNKILFIDELDSSLHNKIIEYIINLFHAGNRAQLIFTTHNTSLLNLNKFRKDQIFFVNKKDDSSSDLYSLYDFKDFRETMDVEKAYLQGRFDAIPYINDSIENLKSLLHV